MNERKTITMDKLFTRKQAIRAAEIVNAGENVHQLLLQEIVRPSMEHINKVIGQENDERYIAYVLEHIVRESVVVAISNSVISKARH